MDELNVVPPVFVAVKITKECVTSPQMKGVNLDKALDAINPFKYRTLEVDYTTLAIGVGAMQQFTTSVVQSDKVLLGQRRASRCHTDTDMPRLYVND